MATASSIEVQHKTGLEVQEISSTEREYWNLSVAGLPTGHILQTYEWGEFKSHHGWQPIRLLFTERKEIKGAALVLKRPLPTLGLSILYVPKGPCFDPADSGTFGDILDSLKRLAKTNRALFIKIDPDIPLTNEPTLHALRQAGFQPSSEQIQYRNTAVVDLSLTEEQIRSNLGKSTRYNINAASRKGVGIVEGTVDDLPLFYEIYEETSKRDGFLIRPYAYYEQAWKTFLNRNMAKVFFAKYQESTLAGSILLFLGNRVWYMYGASRSIYRELRPNHLLQWHAMLWAKANGCVYYDMWGLPNILEPGQPMWGVVEFKKGLGGQVRQWIGAYDYPHFPFLYRIWTRLLPRYMRFLRQIRGLPSAEATSNNDPS